MSSSVGEALSDLGRALAALKVRWYLFGAQAAILYGSTRVTEDIDVTVDLGDVPPTELVSALRESGFELRVSDAAAFVERTRVFPLMHLATRMPIDLVVAGPGIEELFFSRARTEERDGHSIFVASPEDLIVMKILASRPHDHEDIRAILQAQGSKIDVGILDSTIALLEEALGQSDLAPALRSLREERRASPELASRAAKRAVPTAARRAKATKRKRTK